jgi:VanZ family protein
MIEQPVQVRSSARYLFIRYWLPVIFFGILIFYLSSVPFRIRHAPFPYYDKVFHFFEYGIFSGLWYRALWRTTRLPERGWWWTGIITILICSIFGMGDELYQRFTPYRSSDVYDLAADATGALVAVLLSIAREFNRRA